MIPTRAVGALVLGIGLLVYAFRRFANRDQARQEPVSGLSEEIPGS